MSSNRDLPVAFAERLMRWPAAPFNEHAVRTEAEVICTEHDLDNRRDQFGNLIVRYTSDSRQRPIVFAAHMDHPGFEIVRRLGPRKLLARFQGGVPKEFFRRGVAVRILPNGRAELGRCVSPGQFELTARAPLDGEAKFAVWDLPDFKLRNGKIVGRACDDLIGCAAALATMVELKQRRARVNAIALLSRAEEIGFYGALAAAKCGSIPKNAFVISLEASQERPPVKIGRGVVVRVGDKSSVFDAAGTRFLSEVAATTAKDDKAFRFQQALMPGGTCEATAFQELGFQTAAVCVPLGNYHNRGANRKIAAEYVSIEDLRSLTQLLVACGRAAPKFDRIVSKLPRRIHKLANTAEKLLRRNP